MSNTLKGTILVLLAAVLWGTTGTSQGLSPRGVSSSVFGALRLFIAGLIFLILFYIRGRGIRLDLNKSQIYLLVIGTLSLIFYQLSFFYGVRISGVAVGTVIGIGTSPLWGGILGYIFLKEKPASNWYLSTAIAVIGLFLLSFSDNFSNVHINFLGVFLMLIAGLTYAVYSLCAKKLMVKLHPDFVMAVYFMGGGITMFPILLTNDLSWLLTFKGALIAIHLGVFATALSYIFFSRGLQLIPIAKVTTLSLAEPFTASILGIFVLGEKVMLQNGVGMALIFISLLLLSKK